MGRRQSRTSGQWNEAGALRRTWGWAGQEQNGQRTDPKEMGHKRNGGRHCCQPPLRRAKDLPVFVTWWIKAFALSTRSRSWLTSSGVASHPTAPSCEEPCKSTGLRHPRVRWSFDPPGLPSNRSPSAKAVRCSAALLGKSSIASRFAHLPRPLRRGWRLGAASHDRKISLPAPSSRLDPARTRKLFPSPAGGDRTFGHPPHPPAVAGSWGGRDRRPDHLSTMHLSSESRKRNFRL
jgi:hypothetical protein